MEFKGITDEISIEESSSLCGWVHAPHKEQNLAGIEEWEPRQDNINEHFSKSEQSIDNPIY